jgi:hypothetical protein
MKRADLAFASLLVPLDYLALVAAGLAAFALRLTPIFTSIKPVQFALSFDQYIQVVLPMAAVTLVIFALSGLYTIHPRRIATEMTRVVTGVSTAIAAILGIAFFSLNLFESRFIVLAAWALAIVFVLTVRISMRLLQRSLRKFDIGVHTVAIIGKTKSGNELKRFFETHPSVGYRVVAHLTQFNDDSRDRLLHLRRQDNLDAIVLADPETSRIDVAALKVFTDTQHLTFLYSADLFAGSTLRPIMHTFAEQPIIEVPKTPLDGWGAIYKRIVDIIVASILIIITLPLQIIIALAPFLFSRARVGQRGKEFAFLKFRSMIRNAHALRFDPEFVKKYGNEREGTPLFKLRDDPRITRVGRFIRAWSLDEIPQFYSVLMGRYYEPRRAAPPSARRSRALQNSRTKSAHH